MFYVNAIAKAFYGKKDTPIMVYPPVAQLGRREFIVLFAMLISLTAFSIDTMLPALPNIGVELNVTNTNDLQLVIGLFIFGTVCGQIAFGPVADAYGRRSTIIVGILIYLIGTGLAAFSTSLWVLLLGRILQGVGVSGSKIGARALIRDRFVGAQMAQIMSFIMTLFILIPMLAPFLGQVISENLGWRFIFFGFAFFALFLLIWIAVRQPETLPDAERIPWSFKSIKKSVFQIVSHTKVMAYTMVTGVIFGAMLTYLSTVQFMFSDFYDIQSTFPLFFALIASGIGVAAFINGKLVLRFGMQRICVVSLNIMAISAGSLSIVGWMFDGIPPFSVFFTCLFVMMFCLGFIFGNVNAMAMEWLGGIAGIGGAVIGAVSNLIAVVIATGAGRFYEGEIYPVSVLFAVSSTVSLWLLHTARVVPGKHL